MARDYTWLQGAVKGWTHRADLTSQIPDFVMLAEERMSADLEARGLEAISALTTVAGVSSVVLPTQVIDIRSIGIPGYQPLDYLTPDAFNSRGSSLSKGVPQNYTVVGDALYLGPMPDAIYQLSVSGRMTLPPLADAVGGTNWLILRNPSLYLAATMVEALLWLRDDDGLRIWSDKYQVALGTANSTKGTAGDLVVRTDARTP